MKGFAILIFFLPLQGLAQQLSTLVHQGEIAEKQFQDETALGLYHQALKEDTTNLSLLVKCTELNCRIGEKQPVKNNRLAYYNEAKQNADRAFAHYPDRGEASYAEALVYGKLAQEETENKRKVEEVKQVYLFTKKALGINPSLARANYILGKWHLEMLNLSWFKKAALKTLYGGLPAASIDSAVYYMEKCRRLDSYFLPDYLDLAKAYLYENLPQQAIDVLSKLVRMPDRSSEDAGLKAEGQKLLEGLE